MEDNYSFTIIGGGIAGLTTAIALQRLRIRVTLFEDAPVLYSVGAELLLAANAMQAFERLGIAQQIIMQGRQLNAFVILDQQGQTISRTDTHKVNQRYGVNNFTIHRAIASC